MHTRKSRRLDHSPVAIVCLLVSPCTCSFRSIGHSFRAPVLSTLVIRCVSLFCSYVSSIDQSNVRAYSYVNAFVRASVLSFVQTVPNAIVDRSFQMQSLIVPNAIIATCSARCFKCERRSPRSRRRRDLCVASYCPV